MEKTAFANRLRFILEEKNMRQIDLCQKTGIGKSAMSQYLRGSFEPKQQNLHALAEVLGVSEAWLMGYDVPRNKKIVTRDDEAENHGPLQQLPGSFYFTAPDNSMIKAHIPKGAVVLIQKQPLENLQNGDIVLLSRRDTGESCLRFFYQDAETLFFSPANPDVLPFTYRLSDLTENRLQIDGVARQVMLTL